MKDYPYLYYPIIDVQAARSTEPSLSSVSSLLKYGVCVKKCPTGDKNTAVECFPGTYMSAKPNNYANCQFYPAGVQTQIAVRYETKAFMEKICVPAGEQADAGIAAALDTFKKEINKLIGS